jgi:hypothetical protein
MVNKNNKESKDFWFARFYDDELEFEKEESEIKYLLAKEFEESDFFYTYTYAYKSIL